MFWVAEFTNYDYNTHNHLLLKGGIAGDINSHLKSKSLIGDHVKHLPYKKSAISKLLPYSIGKVKPYEEIEEREPMDIKISFFTTPEEEEED